MIQLLSSRKSLALAASLLLGATGVGRAAPLTGFWQAYFEDGRPSGWFYFTDKNGVIEGRLVKMFKEPGETSAHDVCDKCEGAKKNAPMLGLVLVWGMKKNGEKYENGRILDPRDGSVYSAEATVSPDGQKLLLRGYLGISLLGQTQTWTRLPDDSIPAGQIPGLTDASHAESGKTDRKAHAPAAAAKPAADPAAR